MPGRSALPRCPRTPSGRWCCRLRSAPSRRSSSSGHCGGRWRRSSWGWRLRPCGSGPRRRSTRNERHQSTNQCRQWSGRGMGASGIDPQPADRPGPRRRRHGVVRRLGGDGVRGPFLQLLLSGPSAPTLAHGQPAPSGTGFRNDGRAAGELHRAVVGASPDGGGGRSAERPPGVADRRCSRVHLPRAQCLRLQQSRAGSASDDGFLQLDLLCDRRRPCCPPHARGSDDAVRPRAAAARPDGEATSYALPERSDLLVLRDSGVRSRVLHPLPGAQPMSAATRPAPVGARIWYGILGAPVAFGLQEMLDWLISSGACPSGAPADVGGVPLINNSRAILFAIGAAAVIAAVVALWIGVTDWRRSQDPSFLSIRAHRRTDYLAAAAMLVSAVFLIAILWQTVAIFVLPKCEMMR